MIQNSHILILLSLLFLFGCKPESSEPVPTDRVSFTHSVDRETIQIGDPVELTITAWHPTNTVVEMPEIGRKKEVVLLNRDWTSELQPNGMMRSDIRYSLTSFRLGHHLVTTNAITYTWGDALLNTNFPAITLNVESSLPQDASSELADIKGKHKLPGHVPAWLWISLLVALIAFAVGLISSKLWKNRETLIPAPPPIPPHVIAFAALDALKNKELLEKDECNPFYTELSLILRTYLEGRFNLNAPDETTEEIVDEMSRSPELNGAQRNILQEFMRQADMVKFAKGHPDRATMETAFKTTKQFIEETKNSTEEIAAKERTEHIGEED